MQKRGSSERFNLNYLYCINTLSMLSDLPRDLAEDVLLRVPMNSVRAVRSVCKNWNTLSKCLSFKKKSLAQGKAAAKEESEYMVVMVISGQVHLMSTNLHGIHKNQGKLVRLRDPYPFEISKVYHCDGLLLCTMKRRKSFVVWNPYCFQTRWFHFDCDPNAAKNLCMYAIGYDNSKSYKILRFHYSPVLTNTVWYKLFYINSTDFAITISISATWRIWSDDRGVSLKGNTYWIAKERGILENTCFLICFDFTTERFGTLLRLPFQCFVGDIVTLSSVRDEQLAVLLQRKNSSHLEIWITTKIDPNFVSWRKLFVAVVMKPLIRVTGSFFVDEEKKVAVIFDSDSTIDRFGRVGGFDRFGRVGSYIIGENGYFKEVDFEEPLYEVGNPSMCSYVPSLVQIK